MTYTNLASMSRNSKSTSALVAYERKKTDRKNSSKYPLYAGIILIFLGIMGIVSGTIYVSYPFAPLTTEKIVDVHGIVKDENGTPLKGINVSIDGKIDITDKDGEFFIYDVEVGRKEIILEKNNYTTLKYKTIITAGSRNEYRFVLSRGEGIKDEGDIGEKSQAYYLCGGFVLIFSIIVLYGALNALRKMSYPCAMVGCFAGIGIPTMFPLPIILSLMAIYFLISSREEFV